MIKKIIENYNYRFLNEAKLYFTFGGTQKSEPNGKSTPLELASLPEEYDSDEDGINVTDKRISCLSFLISLTVLIGFIINNNTALLLATLARLQQLAADIVIALLAIDWLLVPLLSGFVMTAVTWFIVYMDSHTPGIFPPSPMSSKSRRNEKSRYNLHSSYLLAIAMGPIAALAVYYQLYM